MQKCYLKKQNCKIYIFRIKKIIIIISFISLSVFNEQIIFHEILKKWFVIIKQYHYLYEDKHGEWAEKNLWYSIELLKKAIKFCEDGFGLHNLCQILFIWRSGWE